MTTSDLFSQTPLATDTVEIMPSVKLLPAMVARQSDSLLQAIKQIAEYSPFRQMITPGGHEMSAAITNCGQVGWVTDKQGYRYTELDPLTGVQWPAMPETFRRLAIKAADEAGYQGFDPDVCLINRYQVGAKMGLHQDRDEQDFSQPIVSVSLGLPIIFQFGGANRRDPLKRILLEHGDMIVWGGETRRFYHGVLTLKPGEHPLTGPYRYNLTFRKAQ